MNLIPFFVFAAPYLEVSILKFVAISTPPLITSVLISPSILIFFFIPKL